MKSSLVLTIALFADELLRQWKRRRTLNKSSVQIIRAAPQISFCSART
jgi:hypothetical protein